MGRKISAVLYCLVVVLLCSQGARATGLEQGTISLSGSSNLMFSYSSPDDSSSSRSYAAGVRSGYFIKDDLELALHVSGSTSDSGEISDTAYVVTPLLVYHMPVSDASSVFGGLGAGYKWSRFDIKSHDSLAGFVRKSRGIMFEGLLGWEYFFSSQIALNMEIDVSRTSYHRDRNERYTNISTQLGFSIYFI